MTRFIVFDSHLLRARVQEWQRDMDRIERDPAWRNGMAQTSPRWVGCPDCGAYKGDTCRDPATNDRVLSWHSGRIDANRQRLRDLETWAIEWETPCCGEQIHLVWRCAGDLLRWHEVPCFACENTYDIELLASDLVERRTLADHIHPDRVEVVCWASTNANPWKKNSTTNGLS